MPETNTPQPDGPGDENTPEGARDMHDEVVLPEKKFTSGDGGVSGLKKSTIALSFLAGAALAGGVAALATFDLGSHGKVVADPGASPTSVSASPFPSQSSASGNASRSSSTSSSTSSSPSKSAGGSPTSSAPGGSQTAAPSGGPSRPSSGASSSTPSSSSSTGSFSTGSGSQPSNGPVTENGGSDSGSTSAPTDQNSSNGSNTRQPNNESNAQPPRRPSRTPGTSANAERIASTWRSHVDTLRSGVSLYTVQDGDTLSELAQVMGTSVERLASLNHIRDVDLIRTGQSLRLPLGVHR